MALRIYMQNWLVGELQGSLTDLHKYYQLSQKRSKSCQYPASPGSSPKCMHADQTCMTSGGPQMEGDAPDQESGEKQTTKKSVENSVLPNPQLWRCSLLYPAQERQKLGHSITGADGHALSAPQQHVLLFRELLGNGMLSARVTAGAH